ncbi:MAG: hypothetical protein HY298_26770 [Verrucomicrobia bacterium]|nr:hypothetical protein [Verrucomicrobiota bacterium]
MIIRRLPLLILTLLTMWVGNSLGADETFEILKIGSQTYSNVTILNKTRTAVFISHAGGLSSFKLKDLNPEELKKLGYAPAEPDKPSPLASQLESLTAKIRQTKATEFLRSTSSSYEDKLKASGVNLGTLLLVVLAVWLVLHLFYSFCMRRICLKVKTEPGPLIWLPFLQLIPLHRAAGISPWLFLLYLFVLPGVFVFIYLCAKLCEALGKSAWLVLLVFLPVLNLVFFPYLAFSAMQGDDEITLRTV